MPLLFVLAVWGTVRTFRPGADSARVKLRIVLATAATAGVAVMAYGWIANRFVGDLIPVVVVAATVGMVDLWQRLRTSSRPTRRWALMVIAALGLFGVAANVGVALSFQSNWSGQQILNFVSFQRRVGSLTGQPPDAGVFHGRALPLRASAGQLFIVGNCAGLYMATGLSGDSTVTHRSTLLAQAADLNFGWVPVERDSSIRHVVDISVRAPLSAHLPAVPLATIGGGQPSTLSVQPSGAGSIRFILTGPGGTAISEPIPIAVGTSDRITVSLDPYLHAFSITSRGPEFQGYLPNTGPVNVRDSSSPTLSLSENGGPSSSSEGSLCERLR
jgi:hypothetical protein